MGTLILIDGHLHFLKFPISSYFILMFLSPCSCLAAFVVHRHLLCCCLHIHCRKGFITNNICTNASDNCVTCVKGVFSIPVSIKLAHHGWVLLESFLSPLVGKGKGGVSHYILGELLLLIAMWTQYVACLRTFENFLFYVLIYCHLVFMQYLQFSMQLWYKLWLWCAWCS